MTLEEQIINAGANVEYFQDKESVINFLLIVNSYDHFKAILEIVEVDVINNNYVGITGVSFSGLLYKGSIKKS